MEHTREQQQTSRLRSTKRHSSTPSQFMYEMSHQQPASTTGPHLTSRKKRRGMIEKKRRDKINMSLGELRRLVPAAFEKEGSAKLEKAEILQMTVDYLRMLHECGLADSLTNSVKPSSIRSATPNAAPITSSTLAAVAHPSKSLAPPQTPSSRSSYSSLSSSSSASSTAVATAAAAAALHQSHHQHHLHSAATAAASASSSSGSGTPSKVSKQEATATATVSMTAAAAAAAAHLHHQQHQFHQQQQQHLQTPTAGQDRWTAVAAHNQLHGFNYAHHNQPDLTQSPILDQFYQHHQNNHLHYHQNTHHQQYAYNHSC